MPDQTAEPIVDLEIDDAENPDDLINHVSLMRDMLAFRAVILIGFILHLAISDAGIELPLFVPCLLVGIVMSNTVTLAFPKISWPARIKSLAMISDYWLSVSLARSLMSLQLWTLANVGGRILAILVLQVVMTVAFILGVNFRMLGSTYQGVVLSTGFAGFTLGATPTALANMSPVTKRYGSAPLAFFVDLLYALLSRFSWAFE